MKKIFSTCTLALSLLAFSCTDLDVDVESELTPANFPTSDAQFVAATGPVYTQLSSIYAVNYWRLQELSTDEAIIPARDGNYDDGGRYRTLHLHTWNADHIYLKDAWQWGYGGINTCNRIISLFEKTPDTDAKATAIAEMKTMRALYYFFMMDLFGNVPIVETFPATELPEQKTREQVFAYIEKELKEALPHLSEKTGAFTYGRANKFMAFALLEKMYLNAAYYIGQPRYTEAVAMADSILASGKYQLSSDYMSIFAPQNGPQITETIFAVPYEANLVQGNHFSRYGLHTAIQQKYNVPFRPSIAMSTTEDFYAKFNLPGDVRNNTWLAGKQYESNGDPIMISTTKKGLDASYAGSDGSAKIQWHLEFFPELKLKNAATMDIGNDEYGKAQGVRSIKYYPDPNAHPTTRYQNNDVPVFRLADVMLMKAEAILRGATATTVNGELQTPVVLVNKIRARAKAPLVTGITLDELLEERAREMAWEAWRRNDLIRFGKYDEAWGFKSSSESFRNLYPIPATERALNPNLNQNEGY
ncbi:RagB/SusD family nutrient uptake outer membrane protein [Pontibacter rugosus]|uniref:RagB/SusD family nutrient uptake outer membrane protein n=1 Tax=Pontibacter rugosus TaxID=1745966 RepID=A0ABW3SUV3_9BACT